MATYKIICKYRQTDGQGRTGGWSETYYAQRSTFDDAFQQADLINLFRMPISSITTRFIGITVIDLAVPGVSEIRTRNVVGNAGRPADLAKVCLNIRCTADNGARRIFQFRGFPDGAVVNGVYTPDLNMTQQVQRLIQALTVGGLMLIRAANRSNPLVDLVGVDGSGVVTTVADVASGVGDKVQFYRVKDTLGKPVKGLFTVTAFTNPRSFFVGNWPSGRVVVKGRVRKYFTSYYSITKAEIRGASTRNVGRDFFQFVGRRSARR